MEDAKAVEDAGAFAVVLELVAPKVADEITRSIRIPTIGIGSGKDCDGQILVFHDLVGYSPGLFPSMCAPRRPSVTRLVRPPRRISRRSRERARTSAKERERRERKALGGWERPPVSTHWAPRQDGTYGPELSVP